jgi:hypothetical protein
MEHSERRKKIEALRFADDFLLLKKIKKNKKLVKISSKFIGENPGSGIEIDYLKFDFKVTPTLAPKYHELFKKAADNLGFEQDSVIPFIVSSHMINAGCVKAADNKYLIYLTSALIERMSDQEIIFVIGHELGHAIYDHHQLPVHGILRSEYDLKPNETHDVMRWSRMAEISADRAGLIACEDIKHALGAKVVLSSGLRSTNFDFQIDNYVEHTSQLISSLIKNNTFTELYSTHPFNPLRVNALAQFNNTFELYDAFKIGNNSIPLTEALANIKDIFSSMDGEYEDDVIDNSKTKTPLKKTDTKNKKDNNLNSLEGLNAEELLLFWGSACIASIESGLQSEEEDVISSFIDYDECLLELNKLKLKDNPYEEAYKNLSAGFKKFNELAQPKKCAIIQKLILVARADKLISAKEKSFIEDISQNIGVPESFYQKILQYL